MPSGPSRLVKLACDITFKVACSARCPFEMLSPEPYVLITSWASVGGGRRKTSPGNDLIRDRDVVETPRGGCPFERHTSAPCSVRQGGSNPQALAALAA
jgi:hypothetical protein